jgi:Flp pilus assembly protein TadG
VKRGARRATGDEGQAAVELALVLPFVVLLLLLLAQLGLIVRAQLLVTHAAREGARAAAVANDPRTAAQLAAEKATGLSSSRLLLGTVVGPTRVTVHARLRVPTDLPIVGPLLPDLVLESDTTMKRE